MGGGGGMGGGVQEGQIGGGSRRGLGGGLREGEVGGGGRWGALGWGGGDPGGAIWGVGGGGTGSPYLPLPSLSPYHHHKPNPNLCSQLVWPCQPC